MRLDSWLHPEEVEQDLRLRLAGAILLLYHFLTFWWWQDNPALSTLGNELFIYCPLWPFEHARGLVVLNATATMILMRSLGLAALLAIPRMLLGRVSKVLLLMVGLLVVKLYYYLGCELIYGNYHQMHLIFSVLFLFAARKLFFMRLGLIVIYWLSFLVKLTPSWLYGEYFNSIPLKLPLLPHWEWLVTGASIALIVVEGLSPLGFFARSRALRIATWWTFLGFHLYSGFVVGFFYPTLMLWIVAVLFLNFDAPIQDGYRFGRRDLPAWLLLTLLMAGGIWPYVIPGDVRTTCEGRFLGMCMFDANRQVEAEIEVWKGDRHYLLQLFYSWPRHEVIDWEIVARVTDRRTGRSSLLTGPFRPGEGEPIIFNPAMFRSASRMFGDPYLFYYYAGQLDRRWHPDRIAIRLYQQLDGRPERFQILNIRDFRAENLRYNGWWHNEWIKIPPRGHVYDWP